MNIQALQTQVPFPEMQVRLNAVGNVKVYLLDEIAQYGARWDDFAEEVFHYTIRVA